jgi:hypothetical protein
MPASALHKFPAFHIASPFHEVFTRPIPHTGSRKVLHAFMTKIYRISLWNARVDYQKKYLKFCQS